MGANGRVLDLLGTYEAHLILGVERSRIARWLDETEQGKQKIPLPAARLKCGPIWERSAIEAKLLELATAAGIPPEGVDAWAVERSLQRARQMKPPLPDEELEAIIRRPLPAAA